MTTTDVEFKVHLSLARVHQILTDLTIYGKLHPLIFKVVRQGENRYRFFEKPFDPLPFPISYLVQIDYTLNTVFYSITGIPLTKLYFNYFLKSESSDTTIIRLKLRAESVPMIEKILLAKIVKAQEALWG